jgi:predicted metal-binding protein
MKINKRVKGEPAMARIGILTCSNATQDLGCSSVSCLRELRKRNGAFERYNDEETIDLVGVINCAGCPTLAGYEKLLGRIRALTEFNVDAIHFSFCVDALCPFKSKFRSLLEEHFPDIQIVMGTHGSKAAHDQYRKKINELFCQPRKTMVDIIKGKARKDG